MKATRTKQVWQRTVAFLTQPRDPVPNVASSTAEVTESSVPVPQRLQRRSLAVHENAVADVAEIDCKPVPNKPATIASQPRKPVPSAGSSTAEVIESFMHAPVQSQRSRSNILENVVEMEDID